MSSRCLRMFCLRADSASAILITLTSSPAFTSACRVWTPTFCDGCLALPLVVIVRQSQFFVGLDFEHTHDGEGHGCSSVFAPEGANKTSSRRSRSNFPQESSREIGGVSFPDFIWHFLLRKEQVTNRLDGRTRQKRQIHEARA
jgi:hypothetical protein